MARKDFHHPFTPYEIQQQFMQAVYDCIEEGKVGIFESPTGTGKSLSLICGSLTWLREHKRKTFDDAIAAIQLDDDEPEWMAEHAREARRREARQLRADLEARLEAVRRRERKLRARDANGEPPFKKRKQAKDEAGSADLDEDQFVLDDYESDEEQRPQRSGRSDYSSETTQLMEKLGMVLPNNHGQEEDDVDELKIFFCSRTHSQLSQFVGELNRVKLPPGLPPEQDDAGEIEDLKHLPLGSRKNLCINPKVSKLKDPTAINERCMELQQSKTPADHRCPHLPNKENEELVLDFRDHALAKIRDIEDLANVGAKLLICPYYASRPAIGPSEIVTLPYPLLLQKSARDALGISLKGHVVVIDEAHNLINAIEGIYSSQITGTLLRRARESLMVYLQKFRSRLKGANRVYVTQVIRIVDSLLEAIARFQTTGEAGAEVEPSVLLSGKGVDQINVNKLVRYISDSKLARKVEGYTAFVKESQQENGDLGKSAAQEEVPALTSVQNFLMTLMNPSKEGRFFWSKEGNDITLRYLLLDPSEHFREVVEEARAIILAGGTMSPMEEYIQQLFPYISAVKTLSCGHLIPPSNLLVRIISRDQSGPMDFSHKGRNSSYAPSQIATLLKELAQTVKGGIVVFFPSYDFLTWALNNLRKSHLQTIEDSKPVFSDDRNRSAEETFKAYAEAVRSKSQGAILLSVIGGKLSEGINFSDDLGRCVVVVGLPFPNLHTPEWKAKMEYIDAKAVERGEPKGSANRAYAENVCMRSVNQAIGRVIRHKDDWASIILMDERYEQHRIKEKLPGWIKSSLPEGNAKLATAHNGVLEDVGKFFRAKAG